MQFFQHILDTLIRILNSIVDFIPLLIQGIIILAIGYLVAVIVRRIISFILKQIHLDQLAERAGINNALRSLAVNAPVSQTIAQIVFFYLILSFSIEAVGPHLMNLTAIYNLLNGVLQFIPKAISAVLLLLFGSMLGRFLGDTLAAVAQNANISYGSALGKLVQYSVLAFVVILSLSTLGIDTAILTSSFTIIVAAAGLAIALTFGLGSRDSARNVIAGYYVRQRFQPGQRLSLPLDGQSGTLRATSGTYTILETVNEAGEAQTISLPNTLLLEQAVVETEATTAGQNPNP